MNYSVVAVRRTVELPTKRSPPSSRVGCLIVERNVVELIGLDPSISPRPWVVESEAQAASEQGRRDQSLTDRHRLRGRLSLDVRVTEAGEVTPRATGTLHNMLWRNLLCLIFPAGT